MNTLTNLEPKKNTMRIGTMPDIAVCMSKTYRTSSKSYRTSICAVLSSPPATMQPPGWHGRSTVQGLDGLISMSGTTSISPVFQTQLAGTWWDSQPFRHPPGKPIKPLTSHLPSHWQPGELYNITHTHSSKWNSIIFMTFLVNLSVFDVSNEYHLFIMGKAHQSKATFSEVINWHRALMKNQD